MRLLYAEDEKSLARAVSTILEKNNYAVDVVGDGDSALDYLETGNYDGANPGHDAGAVRAAGQDHPLRKHHPGLRRL